MAERFVKIPIAVLQRRDLGAAAKVVFAAILARIGSNGRAWPGAGRLARDTGLSCATVKRAIVELVGLGVITKQPRGPGRSNMYVIKTPETDHDDPAQNDPAQNEAGQNAPRGRLKLSHDSDHFELQKYTQEIEPANKKVGLRGGDGTAKNDHKARRDCASEQCAKRPRRPADPLQLAMACMSENSHLKTTAFYEAWQAWARYRSERRKALTRSTIERQIRKLEKMGPENAVLAIERSIENGWVGLFGPTDRKWQVQGGSRDAKRLRFANNDFYRS